MNWEAINGITGIISTICAIISIGYLGSHSKQDSSLNDVNILTLQKFMSFTLLCSGWVLCCLSFLWFVEPYGSFMSDKDYQNFFGAVLALPAFIIFMYGLSLLKGNSNDNEI